MTPAHLSGVFSKYTCPFIARHMYVCISLQRIISSVADRMRVAPLQAGSCPCGTTDPTQACCQAPTSPLPKIAPRLPLRLSSFTSQAKLPNIVPVLPRDITRLPPNYNPKLTHPARAAAKYTHTRTHTHAHTRTHTHTHLHRPLRNAPR